MLGIFDHLMRWIRGARFRLSSLWRGRRWREELREEIAFHLEMETEKLAREGLSRTEARRRAGAQLGGLGMIEEGVREARGMSWIEDLLRDLRLGARQLRRRPAFTAAAVVTLALGIGATAAVVSVVHGVLLAPLPFSEPERLTVVWEFDRLTGTQREAASIPDLQDFEAMNRTFDGMAAFELGSRNLTGPDREARHLDVVRASHDLIPLLGLPLAAGRGFSVDETRPNGPAVLVLGNGLWRSEFGGRADVLGATLILNDVPHQVVGVLAQDLTFPASAHAWVPLQEDETTRPRWNHPITVVGRLRPDVTLETAQMDMTRIAEDLEARYPENAGRGVFVEPLTDVLRGEVRPALLVLLGAALMVLLIACVNVANLLLARDAMRAHEFAISSALGATRGRMARRFATESLLLTGTALALGILLALGALRIMIGLAPPEVSALGSFRIQWPVLSFAVALCGVVGLGFGLVPLRQASRVEASDVLSERSSTGGKRSLRARKTLVVAQIALAAGLLVQAGLLIRSLRNLRAVDAGFTEQQVLRADFQLPESRYPRDFSLYPRWPEIVGFNLAAIDRIIELPGVEAVAVGTNHPLDPGFTNSFDIVGRPAAESVDQGELSTRIVTSAYFSTVGLPVLTGRPFTRDDGPDAPMALLLNSAAVDRYFPDGDAIGQRLSFWGSEREVIGIVADERMHGLNSAAPPAMYVPLQQAPPVGRLTLMVRTSVDPQSLIGPVREVFGQLDRDVALFNVATMEETVRAAVARWRFTSALLAVFSAVALLLAVVGVHGVLSFLVTQRTREFGVRMALGAARRDILGMVLRDASRLVALGVVLGLAVAAFGSRLLGSLLFGVGAQDGVTYLLALLTLCGAAAIACCLPAVRATAVDPVRALRVE